MYYIMNNIKKVSGILLVLIIVFFYFGVFIPLKYQLEDSLENNFNQHVSITEINVENYLRRTIEGAKSLSSRTMINKKLEEYKTGQISFENLQEYTVPKYADGAEALQYILSAYRVTDGRVAAKWESDYMESSIINSAAEDTYNDLNGSQTELLINTDNNYIEVKSAIKINAQILGYDDVYFSIKELFENFSSHEEKYEIIHVSPGNIEDISNAEKIIKHRRLLDTDYYLKAEISKANLYKDVKQLSYKMISIFIIILILVISIFYRVLNDSSRKIIKELEQQVEKITEISQTDCLLDVYNRSKFVEDLEKEIDRAMRYNNKLSLIMFDIDYFKDINDTYGHTEGDKVLLKLSNKVASSIREVDKFARYGGDEFMIIVPETGKKGAVKLAERLRKEIELLNYKKIDGVTCSFGVTQLKSDDNVDTLIKRADKALYKAKDSGKNNTAYL